MNPKDMATLKTRVETALADSAKEFGGKPGKPKRPSKVVLSMDLAFGLVNHDDTRAILTDRAVKAIGGTEFTVTVDDTGVTIAGIAPAPAKPEPTPTPVPTPAPAEAPKPAT